MPIPVEDLLQGIPEGLRSPLVAEFGKIQRHYREGRWEPAGLNGGKFAEVVYVILQGQADGSFPSKPSKPQNMVAACKALEQKTVLPRSLRLQIPRVLTALYELRNNRSVGHVGGDVDPNRMDATVVVSMARWVMAELIRVFHTVDTEEAQAAVDLLSERVVPSVWEVEGQRRVLDPNMSASDKALLVLYAMAGPMPMGTLAKSVEYANQSRFRSTIIKKLHTSGLVHFRKDHDDVRLTPVGTKYVEEQLPLQM